MSYSFDKEGRGALIKLSVERVKEIIMQNKKGIIPPRALEVDQSEPANIKYTDGVGEESLNRFDEKKQGKRHGRNRNRKNVQKDNSNAENKPREKNVNAHEAKTVTKVGGNRQENRPENRQGNRPNGRQGNGPKVLRKQGNNPNNKPGNNNPGNNENNKPAEQ